MKYPSKCVDKFTLFTPPTNLFFSEILLDVNMKNMISTNLV